MQNRLELTRLTPLKEKLPLDDIKNIFDQVKLNIRNDAVKLFPDNKMVGFEMGKAYKSLTYSAIEYWYNFFCPDECKQNYSLATFGSTARGELCLHSDTDILLIHNEQESITNITNAAHSLDNFLHETGFRPEIKIVSKNSLTDGSNQDLVDSEIFSTAEYVIGREETIFDLSKQSEEAHLKKAIFTVIEQKNPRIHNLKHDGNDVFNIKWDLGGINDFMILKSIARSYGAKGICSIDFLEELQRQNKISVEQLDELKGIYSEYLIYRNEMHFFADEAAERLGPKTRRFISESIPSVGTPDDIKQNLVDKRTKVHSIYSQVRNQFLLENGIEPNVYENFDSLSATEQMKYASSDNPDFVSLAAWSTSNSEVLETALSNRQDYSILQAASRSSCATPATLKKVEEYNRNNPSFGFSRLMLVVQNNADVELLVNLFKFTKPNSQRETKIRNIARRRLTHFHYDEENEIEANLQKQIETISFYPDSTVDDILNYSEEFIKPSPRKLYINYAGRLANGKNFDAFLRTIYILHKAGVDFESHIFGTMEPSFFKDISAFWQLYGDDKTLIQKLKYHGQYDLSSLKKSVKEMQSSGIPIFLFSKGLASKELLAMGQPLITTNNGNDDVSATGMTWVDESQSSNPDYLNSVASNILTQAESNEELKQSGQPAQQFVEKEYGLEKWGQRLISEIKKLKPESQKILILGTAQLDSPHGPSSWSRNLLKFSSSLGETKVDYVALHASNSIIFQSADEKSNEEEMNVHNILSEVINTVMSVPSEGKIPDSMLDKFVGQMIKLSNISNSVSTLSKGTAKNIAQKEFAKYGISEKQILYPLIACDEVTSYGKPVRPLLRLTHIIEMLQKTLPQSDINISFGTVHPLIAIKEKIENGIPFVYVDHILASDEPLIEAFLNSNYYSKEEKQWFSSLHKLIRQATQKYMDRYIAMWEINQNIAVKQFGIPKEKVVLIPNGIDTEFLKN